eukprot:3243983-Amphidinium_carterae.1
MVAGPMVAQSVLLGISHLGWADSCRLLFLSCIRLWLGILQLLHKNLRRAKLSQQEKPEDTLAKVSSPSWTIVPAPKRIDASPPLSKPLEAFRCDDKHPQELAAAEDKVNFAKGNLSSVLQHRNATQYTSQHVQATPLPADISPTSH